MSKNNPCAAKKVEPFLRWVGGKRQLVATLLEHLPKDIADRRYIEPFLGAASLFFATAPADALLNDANESLIETYRHVATNPHVVRARLAAMIARHSPSFYYDVRNKYNRSIHSAVQAARFMYLNKACFNGIFRVNQKGEFNVPVGRKELLSCPTEAEFNAISAALGHAVLESKDYKKILGRARAGNFVYLDPPYPALNETAYFNHYTKDRFDEEKQETLAAEVKKLHNRGVLFLMSNADVPLVRKLYAPFEMTSLPVRRYVTCKKERLNVSELLIRNY